ncbi:hypothetical protein BaRGS_00021853 [Batillaria attramentaria]|uniref:Uncharacterized protein n=1 Tax=Batillaria attramentaria TaxID=370345 RepID=A0ABD0KIY1_9CAEN
MWSLLSTPVSWCTRTVLIGCSFSSIFFPFRRGNGQGPSHGAKKRWRAEPDQDQRWQIVRGGGSADGDGEPWAGEPGWQEWAGFWHWSLLADNVQSTQRLGNIYGSVRNSQNRSLRKSQDKSLRKSQDKSLRNSQYKKTTEQSEQKPTEQSEQKPTEQLEQQNTERSEQKPTEQSKEKPTEQPEQKPNSVYCTTIDVYVSNH